MAIMRETLSSSFLFFWRQEIISHMKGALPASRGRTPLTPESGNSGWEACVNEPHYFLITQVYIRFRFFTTWVPESLSFFVLSVPHKFINLSKKYKGCLLWPLLRSHFYETSMCRNSNVFLFLLLICHVLMLLLFHAQEPKRVEGEISPSLITHISYKWMLYARLQCKEYQCPEVGRFPHTPCLVDEKCGTQTKVCWFPS